jgi:DNA-binding beta-propeller fold protein YncE
MGRAALCAAVVAVIVMAGGASAGPTKGDGPTVIAAAYGSVWVGSGNGTLVRLDASSGRTTRRLLREPLIQYGFVHSLAVGHGSVWVAQGRYETLKRVDPRTGRTVDIRPRGSWTAMLVAVGGGAVWVGDFERGTVFRVDPRTNRVVARVSAPGLFGLAAGPAGAWAVLVPRGGSVSGPREVRRIDAARNRLDDSALPVDCYEVRIAVGSRSAWVTNACAGTLTRIDGRTGRRSAPIPVGRWAMSPAVGAGAVWTINQLDGNVARVDPWTGRVVVKIRVRAAALAPSGHSVFALDQGDGLVGFVRRIDARTNLVVGRPIRIDPR